MGGTDPATEGTWTWSNGEGWSYDNTPSTAPWSGGEPNDASGSEDCAELLPHDQFNDLSCDTLRQLALCEVPATFGLAQTCGDGISFGGAEQCDDGNTVSGDGCDSSCRKEL